MQDWWIAGAIFSIALAVRLLYLYESSDQPLFLAPAVDADTYHRLASRLAAGEGIKYDLFWQPVFYPLFLSLVYRVCGPSIVAAKLVQAVLGSATCLIVYLLGTRLFDRRVGVIAGLIASFCGPLIYFDGELLATGWAAFWSVFLVYLLVMLADGRRLWLCPVLGVCAALAVITRPTFVPFVAASGIWLVITFARAPRRGPLLGAGVPMLAAAFLLVCLPVASLCDRASGKFTILPYSGGVNLYVGNNPDMCGTLSARPAWEWDRVEMLPEKDGVTEIWAKSAYFRQRVIDYAKADPLGCLAGMGRKAWRFLNAREIPRNVDMYLLRDWSAVLSVLTWKLGCFGFPYGILLPLALIGLVLHCRRVPAPMWLYLVLYPLAVVLVFVTARYRAPVMGVLAVPAAAGAVSLGQMLAGRSWSRAAAGVGGVIVLAALFSLPTQFCEERVNYRAELHRFAGNAAAIAGDAGKAIAEYAAAARLDPDCAEAHDRLGTQYLKLGDLAKAEACYAEALRWAPDRFEVHNNMGTVLAMTGRLAEALAHFTTAVKLKPTSRDAHANLARTLEGMGRPEEAIKHYQAVLRLAKDPQTANDSLSQAARAGLGTSLASLGRLDQAERHLRAALSMNPHDADAHFALARVLSVRGRPEEAVGQYEQVLQIDANRVDAMNALAWLLVSHEPVSAEDGQRAVGLAQHACELTGFRDSRVVDTLATAWAAAGDFQRAVELAERALALAQASGETALADEIRARLEMFKRGQPYRQTP